MRLSVNPPPPPARRGSEAVNDVLSGWRTFSSEGAAPPAPGGAAASEPTAGQAPASGERSAAERSTAEQSGVPGRLAMLLAAMGGAAGGAAVAVLVCIVLGAAGSSAGGSPLRVDPSVGLTSGLLAGTLGGDMPAFPDAGTVTSAAGSIVVDVAGAVARPGLQELPDGARVGDAVEAAGGFAPRVDLAEVGRSLNLAAPLADGAKVLVPALGNRTAEKATSDDSRVDLNSADQAALESLPGIGPVTAGKIMAARDEQPFTSVAELLDRGVVGQSVYEQLVDLVRVSG